MSHSKTWVYTMLSPNENHIKWMLQVHAYQPHALKIIVLLFSCSFFTSAALVFLVFKLIFPQCSSPFLFSSLAAIPLTFFPSPLQPTVCYSLSNSSQTLWGNRDREDFVPGNGVCQWRWVCVTEIMRGSSTLCITIPVFKNKNPKSFLCYKTILCLISIILKV